MRLCITFSIYNEAFSPNINITMPTTHGNNTYMMVKDLETADKIRNEMLKL